jgi:hypothetical protein
MTTHAHLLTPDLDAFIRERGGHLAIAVRPYLIG